MKRISIFAGLVFILDRITKIIIINTMNIGESIRVIDNFFYITSHRNKGAAWGIFQDKMFLFYIITILSLYLFYVIYKELGSSKKIGAIAIGLMVGGTLGNFYDRLFFKEVVDFIDFVIPVINYDFPIWNIADAGLVVGTGLVMLCLLIDSIKEKANG